MKWGEIVGIEFGWKFPKRNLPSIEDFPTPLSPSITTLVDMNKLSSYISVLCALPSKYEILLLSLGEICLGV